MGQTKIKLHKLEIRQKPETKEDKMMIGANTEVFLDGQPLRGVSFLKFEIKSAAVVKVMIEMFADLEVEAMMALPHKELKGTGFKHIDIQGKEKGLAVYELGSYEPKMIAHKDKEENPGCSNAEADKKPFCDNCGCGKKAAYEKKNG